MWRNPKVVAFAPTEPATLGHTLLVPRQHIADVWHLDHPTARALASASLLLAKGIRSSLSPDGMNVIQSNGQAATQTVLHLHVHLVPRWHDDALGRIWPPETSFSERQKDRTYEAIAAAMTAG